MQTKAENYDEDYFLRGKDTGKSLYENYRWLPDLTIPMVQAIIRHLGISSSDSICDFGCARGYTVRAFRELGYEAYGMDISTWALENSDEIARRYLNHVDMVPNAARYKWIIAKDVLEHVPNVNAIIMDLLCRADWGVFAVVPLSPEDKEPYAIPEYEKDVTHIHRLTLASWARKFIRPRWSVEASYRVPGVKDNWAFCAMGNGFITCRRCPS